MQAVPEYLRRDPAFHMNMLDPLLHGDAEIVWGGRDGALIFERESGAYMMSAATDEAAGHMLALVGRCATFVCHQRRYVARAQEKFALSRALACVAAVYERDVPAPHEGLYDIRPLEIGHLKMVRTYYHNIDSDDYMRARIEKGCMWGAFRAGELRGFIGVHAEKSMGMLEVPTQFRRERVAFELEGWLINRLRAQGRTPFGQVFPENVPSVLLQKSLGLTVTEERMYWLC